MYDNADRIVIAAVFLPFCLSACSDNDMPAAEESSAAAPQGAEVDNSATAITMEEMPDGFHGRWDFSETTCADPASEMRLDIAADRIAYYESVATPIAITQTASSELTVVHRFSSEGEEWEETLAYELSEDAERLTVHSPDGSMSTRMRCPT